MGMSAAEWSAYLRDELGVPLKADDIDGRVVAHLLAGYQHELPLLPGATAVWSASVETVMSGVRS